MYSISAHPSRARPQLNSYVFEFIPPLRFLDSSSTNSNTLTNNATSSSIQSYAYLAANSLINSGQGDFKLLISFDYLGGTAGPWTPADIELILKAYGPKKSYFKVDGKPFVSTFEGTTSDQVNAWPGIRSALQASVGEIYLVPCWTSLGPTGFDASLVDGACKSLLIVISSIIKKERKKKTPIFYHLSLTVTVPPVSWDMWPNGPTDVNTLSDQTWQTTMKSSSKTFMMGVSPWFYTNLPQYHKAWVWRGDNAWSLRWNQTLTLLPQFVEIVTWNDYGEAHYIGPILNNSGIPTGAETYVKNYPHEAWLQTLPFQISAYKHAYNQNNNNNNHPAPIIPSNKIIYWYRTTPAATSSSSTTTTNVVGNNAQSPTNPNGYQQEYPLEEILQDEVFAIVLAKEAGSATITIGSSTSTYDVVAGMNFFSKPWQGNTGIVKVAMLGGRIEGSGVEILERPRDGVENFNAWVGCAGECSGRPSGRVPPI